MIKVKVLRHNDYIKGIKVTGHADSGEHGKDLVCAGVSAILVGCSNALGHNGFIADEDGVIDIKEGFLNITVNQVHEKTQTILETLMYCLNTIDESYGKYIDIKFKEE